MPRFFIQLRYNGKNYHGWQVQKNALGVQQVLNEALTVLFKSEPETLGCGRTDTGVHAKQFYAHVDIPEAVDCENVVHRLNGLLPHDIAIDRIFPVKDDLHARFDAVERTYGYFIYFKKDPFLKDRAHWLHFSPDVKKMQAAAALLKNYQDFSCFSKNRTQVKTNICHIRQAEWLMENDMLVFRISADRFLRGMVRAIVGTLLLLGEDKLTTDGFRAILEGRDRKLAGASVPAHGLYLEEVRYDSFL